MCKSDVGVHHTVEKVVFIAVATALLLYHCSNAPAQLSAAEIDPMCDIVMFTTPTCAYCTQARKQLNAANVDWCEKDISRDATNRAFFKKIGGKGVPVAIFGDEKVSGYSSTQYAEHIERIKSEPPRT